MVPGAMAGVVFREVSMFDIIGVRAGVGRGLAELVARYANALLGAKGLSKFVIFISLAIALGVLGCKAGVPVRLRSVGEGEGT